MRTDSLIDKLEVLKDNNATTNGERYICDQAIAIIRQHEAEHPFKDVDDDGWPLEKPSEIPAEIDNIPLEFIAKDSGGIAWGMISCQYENQYGGFLTLGSEGEIRQTLKRLLPTREPVMSEHVKKTPESLHIQETCKQTEQPDDCFMGEEPRLRRENSSECLSGTPTNIEAELERHIDPKEKWTAEELLRQAAFLLLRGAKDILSHRCGTRINRYLYHLPKRV